MIVFNGGFWARCLAVPTRWSDSILDEYIGRGVTDAPHHRVTQMLEPQDVAMANFPVQFG
jgi:hypothetical protein